MPIRLVLADDHPIVLDGLRRLFESQADVDVLCCCADGDAALNAARTRRGDVLVLDVRMGRTSGLDVLRAVAAEQLPWRTVLLTAAVSDDEIAAATELGAWGLVLKESSPETILKCVRAVARGERWMDPQRVAGALGRVLRRNAAARAIGQILTPRELEIVRMTAQGSRNKIIAGQLGISEGTVKVHLHNIYEKLGVGGRMELVAVAREKGLI